MGLGILPASHAGRNRLASAGYSAFHNNNTTWGGPGPRDKPNQPPRQALNTPGAKYVTKYSLNTLKF
jgi:hypothetical protein